MSSIWTRTPSFRPPLPTPVFEDTDNGDDPSERHHTLKWLDTTETWTIRRLGVEDRAPLRTAAGKSAVSAES